MSEKGQQAVNSLRPRRNGRFNADDIFKCIFLKENVWISTKISLKFVPEGPINNIPALVQIMAWRRSGDKPLSEPMMVSLPTHICVTRPQWVKLNHSLISSMEFSILVRQHLYIESERGCQWVNTLRPRENGRHFPDDIFKWIFLNDNVWISINISLKFVPRGPINNIPTLVQVMAWRRPGDKPLFEPMMVRLPTHICFTRPQWVKTGYYLWCMELDWYHIKLSDRKWNIKQWH